MKLLPHQVEGVRFFTSRKSAILADEPGLGKTAQAIMAEACFPADHRIIVAPRNALVDGPSGWKAEFREWAPHLLKRTSFINPESMHKIPAAVWAAAGAIIIDELHMFKSLTAQRTQKLMPFCSDWNKRVYGLTGTPVYSYPIDLLAQLCLIRVFNGYDAAVHQQFIFRYCGPRLKSIPSKRCGKCAGCKEGKKCLKGLRKVWDYRGSSNAEELARLLSPYILRRTWSQVGIQMPPLTFTDVAVDADPSGEYIEAARDFGAWYLSTNGKEEPPFARFTVLRKLLAMAKVKACLEHLEEDLANPDLKVLVFAGFREPVERMHRETPGSYMVEGGQSETYRAQVLADFSAQRGSAVLFATVDSLNVAVNLQAANRVYFLDVGFTPATLEQAFRRSWRLGQTKPVSVLRFYIPDDEMENFIITNLYRKEAIMGTLGLESSASLRSLR